MYPKRPQDGTKLFYDLNFKMAYWPASIGFAWISIVAPGQKKKCISLEFPFRNSQALFSHRFSIKRID